MKMMAKRLLVNILIFSLVLFFTWGCSSSHEVAIVSHGDEAVAVNKTEPEKADVVASTPLEVDLEPVQLEQEVPIQVPTPSQVVPMVPPKAAPSPKSSMGPAIFAQPAADSELPRTLDDVFFDFDQMVIRKDAISLLEKNAKVLLKYYADRKILIQGHCDERGTEAYNLILGKRRANAVKNYLVTLGVEASQLRVLSLGKNQPFCLERTIACLRQNRRAHFVIE